MATVKMVHKDSKTPVQVLESQVDNMQRRGWQIQPETPAPKTDSKTANPKGGK